MTLLEMLMVLALVSLLLTVTFSTVHETLALHRRLMRDGERLVERCALAERLVADARLAGRFRVEADGSFVTRTADGREVRYRAAADSVERFEPAETDTPRRYRVGPVRVWLWDPLGGGWSEGLAAGPSPAVRLGFGDSELVVSGEAIR
jgi:hypothetical protein